MPVQVLTQHNDNARTGANLAESILTPDAVATPGRFGKLFEHRRHRRQTGRRQLPGDHARRWVRNHYLHGHGDRDGRTVHKRWHGHGK